MARQRLGQGVLGIPGPAFHVVGPVAGRNRDFRVAGDLDDDRGLDRDRAVGSGFEGSSIQEGRVRHLDGDPCRPGLPGLPGDPRRDLEFLQHAASLVVDGVGVQGRRSFMQPSFCFREAFQPLLQGFKLRHVTGLPDTVVDLTQPCPENSFLFLRVPRLLGAGRQGILRAARPLPCPFDSGQGLREGGLEFPDPHPGVLPFAGQPLRSPPGRIGLRNPRGRPLHALAEFVEEPALLDEFRLLLARLPQAFPLGVTSGDGLFVFLGQGIDLLACRFEEPRFLGQGFQVLLSLGIVPGWLARGGEVPEVFLLDGLQEGVVFPGRGAGPVQRPAERGQPGQVGLSQGVALRHLECLEEPVVRGLRDDLEETLVRIVPAQFLGVRGRDVQLGLLSLEPSFAVGEVVFAGAELHFGFGADIPSHRLGVTDLFPARAGLVETKVPKRLDQGGFSHLVAALDHGDAVAELQGAFHGAAVVPQGDPVNPHARPPESR